MLLFLVGLLAPSLPATEEPRSVALGPHYRIVCHFEDERIAAEASAVAEAAWDLAAELLPVDSSVAVRRLDVHLYGTVADYEAAEKDLTRGQFREHLCFAHSPSRTAHVTLQPPMDAATRRVVGLPHQTRALLAHEATHLFVYETWPNHKQHPFWLSEGLAMLVADELLLRQHWVESLEADPMSSTDMVRARQILADERLPAPRSILYDWSTSQLGRFERYAVCGLFFRFLWTGDDHARLVEFLARSHDVARGAGFEQRVHDLAEEVLGLDKPDADMRTRFREYVRALEPAWDEDYRSLETLGDAWSQVGFPDGDAVCWRTRPIGAGDLRASGRAELVAGAHPSMAWMLELAQGGRVAVRFEPGVLEVLHEPGNDGEVRMLTSAAVPELAVGAPVSFVVHVEGGELEVALEGRRVAACPLTLERSGRWGLSTRAGSAASWRDVVVE